MVMLHYKKKVGMCQLEQPWPALFETNLQSIRAPRSSERRSGAALREAGALVGAQLRKRTRSASRSATPKKPGARPGARAPTFMLNKIYLIQSSKKIARKRA